MSLAGSTSTTLPPGTRPKGALPVPLSQGLSERVNPRFAGGMRAAIFHEPRRIEAGDRPDPSIVEPTDAIVRVVIACVCGSDLWYYRGDSEFAPGPIGHDFIGVVEDTGAEVTSIKTGQLGIAPFAFS